MDIHLLVNLTKRAWAMETLAHLHAGVPGRQAPLLAATGAGRTAFGESLVHLQALGLLERNPGHGHPLRPEFRLTAQGVAVAAIAHRVRECSDDLPLLRRRWSLPVLSLTQHPQRFSAVKQGLVRVTDRALSQSLTQLEDHGWMRRSIDADARPLRATYQAAGVGLSVAQAISGVPIS